MRSLKILLGAALVAAFAAGCGGSEDNPLDGTGGADGKTIVVGSAGFPGNILLAELYAGALEDKGLKVERKLGIGEREVYYKLIEKGELTVLPEYNGALLAYLDPKAALPATTEETNKAASEKLPDGLKLLDSAAAQDNDSLTVTSETASKHGLKTVEDLKAVAGDFAVGGPAPFEDRFKEKLNTAYGLSFKEWVPDRSGGGNIPTWLKSGKIQVGNVFTANPAIVLNGLVVLEDTKGVFGLQNITPLVREDGVGPEAEEALNKVSAQLTTEGLLEMMKKVAVDKADPAEVAAEWLDAHPV